MSEVNPELVAIWQTRGIEPTVLADGTLAAPDMRLGTGPTLLADSAPAGGGAPLAWAEVSTERLLVGALLGRGGMGEVHVAEQVSLRREVATKTVFDATSPVKRAALLKEAWVGAALAHPNVASVHTLARHDGALAVVMKRIEGTSWGNVLLGRGGHERFHGPARFDAHLRVFAEVCRAVAFAHRKGVLHLDLKPENVMVGDFGEVYVLDWGLACATADGPRWLARPTSLTGPAGTPAYMAPELAAPEVEKIGPCTDVYLLGAILHEVVTGQPPHAAKTAIAALAHAYTSAPFVYEDSVPDELERILHRALARDPEARFASVDALREAVEGFLRHRGAEHFAARAEQTLQDIAGRLVGAVDPEVEALLSEADVAIEQTRREWPEHPRLVSLDRTLLEHRTRHALVEERLDAARAFHALLGGARPDLAEAIEALARALAERARHVQSLEAIGHDLDLTLGSTERQRIFVILGALWAMTSLTVGFLDRRGHRFGYAQLLVLGAVLVAVLVPYSFARRDAFFQNRANIRLYGGLIFTAVAVELWWIACIALGVPVRAAIAVTPVFYTYAFATLAFVIDRRFLRGALALLATAALAACFPAWALDCVGLGGGTAVALTVHAWRRA